MTSSDFDSHYFGIIDDGENASRSERGFKQRQDEQGGMLWMRGRWLLLAEIVSKSRPTASDGSKRVDCEKCGLTRSYTYYTLLLGHPFFGPRPLIRQFKVPSTKFRSEFGLLPPPTPPSISKWRACRWWILTRWRRWMNLYLLRLRVLCSKEIDEYDSWTFI